MVLPKFSFGYSTSVFEVVYEVGDVVRRLISSNFRIASLFNASFEVVYKVGDVVHWWINSNFRIASLFNASFVRSEII